MLTKNLNEIFGPLLLVKRTQSNLWLQWSGSRDKEHFSGPKSQKCNVTSVNRVNCMDLLQVWDDVQEV